MKMEMKIKYLFRGSAHGGAALINPPTPKGSPGVWVSLRFGESFRGLS